MIWCLRWCCSHVVSLWLSMMWVCWLILGNLWDLLFQWVLFWESLFSVVWCHILILHWLPFCLLVFICGRLTLLCHFKNDFPISGTGVKVCCTFIWSIPVHPYWLGLCIQKKYVFLQWIWFTIGSTAIVSFCNFIVYVASNGRKLGEFLKVVTWLALLVLDMML